LFAYDIDQQALERAEAMDSKLLLVSNAQDLQPEPIVQRYKAVADIERGFRVLKSEIDIYLSAVLALKCALRACRAVLPACALPRPGDHSFARRRRRAGPMLFSERRPRALQAILLQARRRSLAQK
jgi:hypothetical protein